MAIRSNPDHMVIIVVGVEHIMDWSVAGIMVDQRPPDVGDDPGAATIRRSPAAGTIDLVRIELHAPEWRNATRFGGIPHVTDGRGHSVHGGDQPVGKPGKDLEHSTRIMPLGHAAGTFSKVATRVAPPGLTSALFHHGTRTPST